MGLLGQDLFVTSFLCPTWLSPSGAHGLREEPEFVTARAGESVVLRCDVIHPVTGQPPPYVVEWFKFGVPIPIFIKFGYYPPHVDPEYAGKVWAPGFPHLPQLESAPLWFPSGPYLVLTTLYLCFPVSAWFLPSFVLCWF